MAAVAVCGVLVAASAWAQVRAKIRIKGRPAAAAPDEKHRPKLLADLPDEYNTPDGMRLDKRTGDMIVACPNFNEKQYPGKLIKITPDNRIELYFADLPKHPDTGYACPMGMDFGPDGNLYYADNQYFYNKDYRSRIVRVNVKDGKPVSAEVAVEGFKLANGAMFRGDNLYVTETFFDLADKPGTSGVYRIPLADMKKGVVKLKPKGQPDPYLLDTWQTRPLAHRKGELAGADGMTFDSKGDLYVGDFGDGQFFKFSLNADGTLKSRELLCGPPRLTCCDGMFCDNRTDKIYIADSERNAIQVFDTKTREVTTLWENGDASEADKAAGLLDQPCEPAIRGDDLIICNFDMPFPGLKNTKYNKPHTISVIKLK
jgi:sugar lactone lactonase YvrE